MVTVLAIVVVLAIATLIRFIRDRNSIYIFKGIRGPQGITQIPKLDATPWSRYASGTESRLAVLLTDASGAWLGLSHGLKSIGVPFLITTDYQQAVKHSVVLVYPMVSGNALSPEALKALAAVPRQGGTLVGFNVLGGGLNEVFGFSDAVPSGQHRQIQFSRAHPLTSSFIERKESVIEIGNRKTQESRGATVTPIPRQSHWRSTKTGRLPSLTSRMATARRMPLEWISDSCCRRVITIAKKGLPEAT